MIILMTMEYCYPCMQSYVDRVNYNKILYFTFIINGLLSQQLELSIVWFLISEPMINLEENTIEEDTRHEMAILDSMIVVIDELVSFNSSSYIEK